MESVLNKFEAYLLTEKRVSTSTFEAYKRDVRQLVLYLKGEHKIDLKRADRNHLKDFLYHLKTNGSTARTMSRKISAIKVLYRYLSTYLGWKNISDSLIFPKLEKKLPQYLTENEVETLFDVAEQDNTTIGVRNKIMLYLLYVSGMRISEMVSLRISQIQFDSSFINVSGKGGKGRIVPVPVPMMEHLKAYIETTLQEILYSSTCLSKRKNVAKKKKIKIDYLFPVVYSGKVKAISRQSFWKILKEMWKKTGSKRQISPHQLRHSLATHMLKKGVDLRSLQMLLGHENLSTVQIYTHLDIGYLRDVYDKKHPRA